MPVGSGGTPRTEDLLGERLVGVHDEDGGVLLPDAELVGNLERHLEAVEEHPPERHVGLEAPVVRIGDEGGEDWRERDRRRLPGGAAVVVGHEISGG